MWCGSKSRRLGDRKSEAPPTARILPRHRDSHAEGIPGTILLTNRNCAVSPRASAPSQRPGSLGAANLLCALAVVFLNFPVLSGHSPDLQTDLKAAATAEQSGHYEEAATLYQKLLSEINSSKADPTVLVQVRTRLATAYYLLNRYGESIEAVA